MPQRFANIAFEARSQLFPACRQVEHEVGLWDFPEQFAEGPQRPAKLVAHPAPMNPIPILNPSHAVAHRARRQMFKTVLDDRAADLRNERIGPQQTHGNYFERSQPAPADDQWHYRNTLALRITQ